MENELLIVLLIPLLTGIICLLFWNSVRIQKALFLTGNLILTLAAINLISSVWSEQIITLQGAGWEAPFGISFVADFLSSIMVLLTAIAGLTSAIYSLKDIDGSRLRFGFYPLMSFLVFSVCGAFLSGDVFNLYVWFEMMLISSFVLMALGNTKPQLEGAIKYVTINIVASAFFLAGTGVLYSLTGTLNMADLAVRLPMVENKNLATLAAVFFFIAFGAKAAIFPLFSWLPASYHTPPVTISAIFAALLTKVGVYAFIRFFTLIFNYESQYIDNLLLITAGTTMLVGVLGAAAQMEFRKILSFHIISQIGYMIMGLALGTKLALAGAVFYIMHHIIVKANLFLISGVVYKLTGSFELKKIGGVYKRYPILGILFIISAFSLAGFPPLSGFWAKFILVKAGLEIQHYLIVVVALLVGFLTLYSMVKIWNEAFWKEMPKTENYSVWEKNISLRELTPMMIPIVVLASITLVIGFWSEPFMVYALTTAEQLLSPDIYIEAILGKTK